MQLTGGVAVRANTVLAAYLAETGLTQAGLADAVNAVVEDLTGIPGRASDRWVRMLVDGSIRWPRHHYRQALEIVLQARMDELGFRCPVDAVSANHAVSSATAQMRLSTADVVRLGAPLDRLVASADGCGAATLADPTFTREDGHRTFALFEVIVKPEHQGQGIGRRIHDELLAKRSEQRVTIATHHCNTHARNTYTRWGYHHIGTRQPTPPAPLLDVFLRARVYREKPCSH